MYKDTYQEVRNAAQNLIRKKEKAFLNKNLKLTLAILKKLWENLKQVGLDSEDLLPPRFSSKKKEKRRLTFDPFTISEVFQKFYSNLAADLVKNLSAAVDKFGLRILL